MGYNLQAFICGHKGGDILVNHFANAINVDIGQGLNLIPMTEAFFDEINDFSESPSISKFKYLTERIEQQILNFASNHKIAYVEAEYFGGQGTQMGLIWNKNLKGLFSDNESKNINRVLIEFDIVRAKGKDEFETLNLGRHRNTIDWFNEYHNQ